MRVPLLILLICLISFNCSTKKRTLTDWDKIGLKGQVKYLKFESHLTEDDGKLASTENKKKQVELIMNSSLMKTE